MRLSVRSNNETLQGSEDGRGKEAGHLTQDPGVKISGGWVSEDRHASGHRTMVGCFQTLQCNLKTTCLVMCIAFAPAPPAFACHSGLAYALLRRVMTVMTPSLQKTHEEPPASIVSRTTLPCMATNNQVPWPMIPYSGNSNFARKKMNPTHAAMWGFGPAVGGWAPRKPSRSWARGDPICTSDSAGGFR